jgi:hypothetical protein
MVDDEGCAARDFPRLRFNAKFLQIESGKRWILIHRRFASRPEFDGATVREKYFERGAAGIPEASKHHDLNPSSIAFLARCMADAATICEFGNRNLNHQPNRESETVSGVRGSHDVSPMMTQNVRCSETNGLGALSIWSLTQLMGKATAQQCCGYIRGSTLLSLALAYR